MNWPVNKLNAICEISMGQAPDGSTYNHSADGLPLVAGAGDFGDYFPSVKKYTSAPGKRSAVGDIILCIRATIGDINWSDKEYCLGRGVAGLRASDGLLDSRFLWHFISARRSELEARGTGSTFKQVSRADIAEWLIPTPPVAEQQRIAAILDKADRLCRKRQQAVRLTDEFLRSTFVDMFGDPIANDKGLPVRLLGDLCSFYAGNSLPSGEPFDGQTGGFLHIKVGDMNLPGNEVDMHIAREWSSSRVGAIIAPAGSILIPKRGGAIATNKKRVLSRPSALDPNLMAIGPGEEIRQEVLLEWFKQFDLSSIASGSAVPQLNKGDLAPLKINVPPLELQNKFVKIAKKVKSMLARQGDQLALIQSASAALSFTLLDNGPKND
jgi:type I restriction enzyme S subunit